MTNPLLRNRKPDITETARPEGFCQEPSQETVIYPDYLPEKREALSISDITAVIVNFKTLHLVKQAYGSLREHYDLPVILVDNHSQDESAQWVREQGGIVNSTNVGHGPAMDAAIERVTTPYVLTLDSDCIVNSGGFLEEMLKFFSDPQAYAIGWLRYVDRVTGVPLEWHLNHPPGERFVRYLHPAVAIYDVAKYRGLARFYNHGAPALQNMLDAEAHGYAVADFPVFRYVTHLVAGTRRMYDGRWDPRDNENPKPWKKNESYPI